MWSQKENGKAEGPVLQQDQEKALLWNIRPDLFNIGIQRQCAQTVKTKLIKFRVWKIGIKHPYLFFSMNWRYIWFRNSSLNGLRREQDRKSILLLLLTSLIFFKCTPMYRNCPLYHRKPITIRAIGYWRELKSQIAMKLQKESVKITASWSV